MILCLNLNAAIDKTILVSSFEINKIHRPESVITLAGGKGGNVARALRTLGEEPVVSGWIGGLAGQFIEEALHREGIQTDFVITNFESRTCLSIVDLETRSLTEIYEKGEAVPADKVDELYDHIRRTLGRYKAITLSGSLPPGVPANFYARVIEIARASGILTFLDTSGEALSKAAAASPFFIKPNQAEARGLLGLDSEAAFDHVQGAVEIAKRYQTNVLLSLGGEGAIAVSGQETFIVQNPTVEAKSAVGSGDCMLAGLTYGILHGLPLEEALVYGVAAGTANTLTMGAGRFNVEDFERVRGHVHLLKV